MVMKFLDSAKRNNKSYQEKGNYTSLKPVNVEKHLIPKHVAIIMDGNNRWAKNKNMPGIAGHRNGVEAIRKVLSACEEFGIEVLTLFAFSSENWSRPSSEVEELMRLLKRYLQKEVDELHKQHVCLKFIGRRDRLNSDIVDLMAKAELKTKENKARTLVLAVDYGGRWDITEAARILAQRVLANEIELSQIDEDTLGYEISTAQLPEPDLCIRTGGESRISNFMLWQFSYAELYFSECYWPDFGKDEMKKALEAYSSRQRRFGKTSEQIETEALKRV